MREQTRSRTDGKASGSRVRVEGRGSRPHNRNGCDIVETVATSSKRLRRRRNGCHIVVTWR
eukprot:1716465-Pleurochrysis_carterae.AAC.1